MTFTHCVFLTCKCPDTDNLYSARYKSLEDKVLTTTQRVHIMYNVQFQDNVNYLNVFGLHLSNSVFITALLQLVKAEPTGYFIL